MTSVREALGAFGQAVSIKEVAHQQGASFPVSVRNLVGALPPGRILQKVISLDFLQRKFDQFFNERPRPIFQVKLNNSGSGDHRHSTVDVLFDDATKGYTSILKDDQPHDLGQLEADYPGPIDPDVHFSDVNSRALLANVVPGSPVGVAVDIRFETDGVEMIVNNHPNVNFTYFNIRVQFLFEHDSSAGLVNLRTDKNLIKTST
jgi:hypothetical protein